MKIDFYIIAIIMILPIYFMYRVVKAKNKGSVHYSFFTIMLFLTLWYIGSILLTLNSGKGNIENISMNICYIGIILVPVAFLITSITYIKGDNKFYWHYLLLFIIPAISIFLVWTNQSHQLFFIKNSSISTEIIYGSYFYFHAIYSYLCMTIAFIVFLISSVKNSGAFSMQSILIFLGGIVPFLVNMALTFKYINVNINATLIAMSFTMLCYWIAIFKYNFLNIVPIAIKKVVDNISDAFVVIDKSYTLIQYNKAFFDLFLKDKENSSCKKMYLTDVIKINTQRDIDFLKFEDYIKKSILDKSPVKFEKYFSSIDKFFFIEINSISSKNNYLGTIILLKDITEYKKILEKIKSQNDELTIVNEQLSNYAVTVKELTLEKERNRIETEIHNLMGHNLNVLLRLIEVCKITVKDDPDKALSAILDAESTIIGTMDNVRKVAKEVGEGEFLNQNHKNNHCLSYLEVLLSNFKRNTGVNVEYSFEGDFSSVDRSLIRVIYNICQEAMTNSLKHGKANMITIFLRCQQSGILLSILDDGIGCTNIKKSGMGLKGMQEMVNNYSGNIEFKSDENDGFKISVTIPLKECAKVG